jgi:uncharacterized protein YgfB (UPF0149 family)
MAYQILSSIFQPYNSDLSVAQAHGMATAMLCVDDHSDSINWLNEIFEAHEQPIEEDKAQIINLFEQTRKLLNPDESLFEFDLFLPENVDLSEQAITLANWCEGFLWGIGYAQSKADWKEETDGILRDMVAFTKLDSDVEDDNDDDEAAFIQVHEYLRAAVLIIRDELNSDSNSQP